MIGEILKDLKQILIRERKYKKKIKKHQKESKGINTVYADWIQEYFKQKDIIIKSGDGCGSDIRIDNREISILLKNKFIFLRK